MTLDVRPSRAGFGPGDDVELVVTGSAAGGTVTVSHLGAHVARVDVGGDGTVRLGPLPLGGYAVRLTEPEGHTACTAFDVLLSPRTRPRYGFLSEFHPGREDMEEALAGLCALHLNTVQFYDWAFEHSDLVGEQDEFVDPCGRPLSHATTRRLVAGCRDRGALAIGYAAVYGVTHAHADAHPDQLLYHRDGTPRRLGDLLEIGNVSRGNPWHGHVIGQFTRAVAALGFDGLHLDTYGAPKVAWDADGKPVDLAEEFVPFLEDVRRALPDATLIFNNVNGYPTWSTAGAPLDVTYVEVWEPHTGYGHLQSLVREAQLLAPGRPVVLAAYLVPFAEEPGERAEWAARLALATVFANGGHHLLCGEGDAVLTDPYYPRFTRVGAGTLRLLRAYFDFAVAVGDVLYDPRARDVTHAHLSTHEHDDLVVTAPARVAADPAPGTLWVTARKTPDALTVHLIDLSAQSDTDWNTDKNPGTSVVGAAVRIRWHGDRVLFGCPELGPELRELDVRRDGDVLVVDVPPFRAWGLLHLPLPPT